MSADAPLLPTTDPELRRADLPHGVVTYTDEGPAHAPVLIAVHGIPGSVRDFAAWSRTTGHVLLDSSTDGSLYRFVLRHK